jgi:hypothetical protein
MEETLQQLYWETKELLRLLSKYQAGVIQSDGFTTGIQNRAIAIWALTQELDCVEPVPSDGMGQLVNYILDEKVIRGALKQAIDAHGSITAQWIPSAAKRLRAQFKQRANLWRKRYIKGDI